ncbi:matrixin family metalloprotease [Myxococcus sp. CA051A]|uniref:myxosortase-dependent metalloprotease, MXAN_2677/MXAN_2678 family n=1 Tax=Myxococcus sp. CA051A TaxID=2741739 RepID=UPI00157B1556|nr:myxosortase-dependent metalloprotease, MXAN_2677/MXAN_2678 family [Myxococcus sp. CA051A]NTX61821.1 matrixin family metalloprotease [Myxococcus sp. CA051A]
MRTRWLLGLVLLASSPALAQEEFPYRRTVVPGRPLCLLWPVREYIYHLDADGSARTPGDTEVAAIEASFESWRQVSKTCSDYAFKRGDDWSLPVVVGYDQERPFANYNIVTFRETSCDDVVAADDPCWDAETCGNQYTCWEHGDGTIGLTTSTFSFTDGRVLDSDIELNASQPGGSTGFLFTTVDSPPCLGVPATNCVATDLQNTMTHEIGHVVGLDHVPISGATMEPTAPPGETRKRIIDAGSAAGFCSIYPRGLPPNQCLMRAEAGIVLLADGRGTGCAAAPDAGVMGAWLAALAFLRGRRRTGGRRDGTASTRERT